MDRPPLPGTLNEIARIVGRDAALTLALHLGGARVNIPQRWRKGNELDELIGIDAAKRMSKTYGGERLLIPSAKHALIHWLHIERKPPMSVRDTALAVKLSERTVYAVLEGRPADDRQIDLFRASAQ